MPNEQKLYYVNTDNGPAGPYTLAALHTMVQNGQLLSNVEICQVGTQYWMPLFPVDEDLFRKTTNWFKDKAVNGLFVNSKVLEMRVSFSGRTRRRNCIMTQLCCIGFFVLSILAIIFVIGYMGDFYHEFRDTLNKDLAATLAYTFGILLSLPFAAFACWLLLVSISTFVRRLHDIGLSGWFYLFAIIPYLGDIWLIVICCIDSERVANRYGETPKGIAGNVYPNPYGGVGMPTVPVMPPPPYPTANQTRPVMQMPIPSFPQPLATPASIPVCPPPPVPPQVEVIQPPPPSPAFSHGVGSPTTQPPLVNQTPAALQQQVVSPPPVAPAGEAPQPPSPEVSVPGTKTMYFVQIDGAKQGPFEAQRIVQMIADGQITADTQVWAEGMTQWQPVRQVQLM